MNCHVDFYNLLLFLASSQDVYGSLFLSYNLHFSVSTWSPCSSNILFPTIDIVFTSHFLLSVHLQAFVFFSSLQYFFPLLFPGSYHSYFIYVHLTSLKYLSTSLFIDVSFTLSIRYQSWPDSSMLLSNLTFLLQPVSVPSL